MSHDSKCSYTTRLHVRWHAPTYAYVGRAVRAGDKSYENDRKGLTKQHVNASTTYALSTPARLLFS